MENMNIIENISSCVSRTPRMNSICSFCKIGKENINTCSRCKTIIYCSRECQKKDWSTHKLSCNKSQKSDGIKTTEFITVLTSNPSAMKVMAAICHWHFDRLEKLSLSFIERDDGYICIADSFPLEHGEINNIPRGNKGFGIICLRETDNITTTECRILTIPNDICKSDCKELFGNVKHNLPIIINIFHDIVAVYDNSKNLIKVIK